MTLLGLVADWVKFCGHCLPLNLTARYQGLFKRLFQRRHLDRLRIHGGVGGVRVGRGRSAAAAAGGASRGEAAQEVEEAVHVGDVRQHGALQQEDNLNLVQSGTAAYWFLKDHCFPIIRPVREFPF